MNGIKLLVLVDVQNDFIQDAAQFKAFGNLENFLDCHYEDYNTIIGTLDIHKCNGIEKDYIEHQYFPVHCLPHSTGAAYPNKIARYVEQFVEKDTFMPLKNKYEYISYVENAEFIDIAGFVTDICVLNTALLIRAMNPKARIRIIEDCCAGTSKENHQAAIQILKMNCIEIVNTETSL